MAAASNYTENLSLRWLLTANTVTRPTNWFLGLYTTATDDTTGGTEISGGAYIRQAVAFSVTDDTATNSSLIQFPTATATWGTVGWIAIHDAQTGGNRLFHGPVTTPKTITTDDIFQVGIGNLSVVMA
jgi:hypothetical protein